jgi:membrane protein DedA with SNARE-associated domain
MVGGICRTSARQTGAVLVELDVQGFFVSFMGQWSYLGLFLVLMMAGLGVPLPEDIPLAAAGWLVHRGGADLGLMIATGLIGVMLGDSILFFMGRKYGMQIVEHRWLRRFAKPWLVEKARRMYSDHGAKIIFAARFMPGLRAMLFLTAGVFRIPYWKFILIDGSAALISVPTWIYLSSRFSGTIEDLLGGARLATFVIGGALLAALLIWVAWEYFHNLRRRNGIDRQDQTTAVRSAPLKRLSDHSAKKPSGEADRVSAAGGKAKSAEPVKAGGPGA